MDMYAMAHVKAEFLPAKTILMHEPSRELFLGVLHPDAALFEGYFSSTEAKLEHQAYRRSLLFKGVNVLTVRDILLLDTIDIHGQMKEGDALVKLRAFSKQFLTYEVEGANDEERAKQMAYLDCIIDQMHPMELVDVILFHPTVKLKKVDINTKYTANYILNPVMNLYFMRDQMTTTAKGIIINRMNSEQRYLETSIVAFCLGKLHIKPIHRIEGEGAYLEGGDFFPLGETALIGCGLRTTQIAIDQLMEVDAFGTDTVVVVKDQWLNQQQMHLDTYFNIIDKDLCVLIDNRLKAKAGDKMYLKADIYKRTDGQYHKIRTAINFVHYLQDDLRMNIIPVSEEDQLHYGINFLTISPREIMAVEGVSDEYIKAFKEAGVVINWIDFTNLTKGYGAAHCSTQVIRR